MVDYPVNTIIDNKSLEINTVLSGTNLIQVGVFFEVIPFWSVGFAVATISHKLANSTNELNFIVSFSCSDNGFTPSTISSIISSQDLSTYALHTKSKRSNGIDKFTKFSYIATKIFPNDTNSHEYGLRVGNDPGNLVTVNGINGSRRFGGSLKAVFKLIEIKR